MNRVDFSEVRKLRFTGYFLQSVLKDYKIVSPLQCLLQVNNNKKTVLLMVVVESHLCRNPS